MNKKPKPACKKVFVRNTEIPKPKVIVVNEQEINKPLPKDKPIKKPQTSLASLEERQIKYDRPELNSAMRIVKKMEQVEFAKPKVTKQPKPELAVDEKLTRKVNFPYDQHIFKDLISLCTNPQPLTAVPSREPLPNNDVQPELSDFHKPKTFPEFSFQAPSQNGHKSLVQHSDCLKLYRTMQNWC